MGAPRNKARWVPFFVALFASLLWTGCNLLLNNNPGQLGQDGGPNGGGDSSMMSGDGACCAPGVDGGNPQPGSDSGCSGANCNPQQDACSGPGCTPPPDSGPPPPCMGAACNPTAIAMGQNTPYALVVDSTTVYFTNHGIDGGMGTGSVASVPIGGGMVSTLVPGLKDPSDIAIDATNVYWISHDSPPGGNGLGDLATVAKTGGSPAFVVQGIDDFLNRLAIYNGSYFWALNFFGDIVEQPVGSINSIQLTSNFENIGGMVVDSTGIYATVGGDTSYTGMVASVGFDAGGGALYDYQMTGMSLGGLAVDATNVYYANPTDGTIDRLQKMGNPEPPPYRLVNAQNNPSQVAVDSFYVYWTTQGTQAASFNDGTVMKVPITGGSAIMLASGQKAPRGIALDATNVYWTNMGDGTVMQRAK